MNGLRKRIKALEGAVREARGQRPYVWVRPGQPQADALAESEFPDDAGNEFFTWKESE